MSVLDLVRVVVYRFHEKGLEIFLMNSDIENDPDIWRLPEGSVSKEEFLKQCESISLDPVVDRKGNRIHTMAIEGEWHDMPSLRGMLKHDVKLMKSTIKEVVPSVEKGGFFGFKEAVKKLMPEEYAALKELKDVLVDRNTTKYI